MKSIYTHVFSSTQAFATLGAIVSSVNRGHYSLSTFEYPFIASVFKQMKQNENWAYRELVKHCDTRKEKVGFEVILDKEGNEIRRKVLYNLNTTYTLNPDKVNQIIQDLKQPENKEAIEYNIKQLQMLL